MVLSRIDKRIANIFMRDNGLAIFENLITEGVVAVVVGVDRINDRQVGSLSNFRQYFSGFCGSGPSIYYNDPFRGDDKGRVRVDSIAVNSSEYVLQYFNSF